MPDAEQILAALRNTANNWQGLAVFWHVYFAGLLAGFLLGAIASRRLAGLLMALPLGSVSGLAWLAGNPFNGGLFALAGLGLVIAALRLPDTAPAIDRRMRLPGLLMFAFGWAYPHFLEAPGWAYLYAAPTGLIPCPTLSILTGLALLTGGLGSAAWSGVLAAMGLFYGLFGALVLGIALDWGLVAGAACLAFATLRRTPGPRAP